MGQLTEQKVKEYMWQLIKFVDPELNAWNEIDMKEFFVQDECGSFLLVGYTLGRGHSSDELDAVMESVDSLEEIIEDIDFN